MRSKTILIISAIVIMSMTLQTNLPVYAQNDNASQRLASNNLGGYEGIESEFVLSDKNTTRLTDLSTDTPTPEPLPPVGPGKYDDRDSNMVFSGNWSEHGISNLFSGTETYSTIIGSNVSLSFTGGSVSLNFRKHTFFGEVTVKIDGQEVATIDQYLPYEVRTGLWTSEELDPNSPHIVTFTHASGKYMSVDAITVNEQQPTDVQEEIPTEVIPTEPVVVPTEEPTSVPATAIPATIAPTKQPTATIVINNTNYGTYDDKYFDISYGSTWIYQKVSGNYLGTEHYSKTIGSAASFTFTGESITVIYRGYPVAFGNMVVTIDGQIVDTIDQGAVGRSVQNKWTSGKLTSGTHTITLTHQTGTYVTLDGFIVSGPPAPTPTATNTFTKTATLAPTNTSTPLPPVGLGTYDNTFNKINYGSTWIYQKVSGNYLGTEHYSKTIGSTASFTFNGESITVIYRGYPVAFGNMVVAIDGQIVDTIDQGAVGISVQNKWTSGKLTSGTHTITLTHQTGTYVTLDGFIVSGPPAPTPTATNTFTKTATLAPTKTSTPLPPVGLGTYDNTFTNINYGSTWIYQKVSSNYLGTEHYSKTIGSAASFTFTGESITVIYRGYTVAFGNMVVAIDGQIVDTIDQGAVGISVQNKWTSGKLTSGTHTITLTHQTGTYVTLDGFIVSGPPTPTPTATNTFTKTATLAPTNTRTPTKTLAPTNTGVPTNTQAATTVPTAGTNGMFYVDSVAGSDTNSGTSISSPWKSLSAITSRKFNPGSIISFKRGSSFTGTFNIDDSGTAASPIIFTAYGSGQSPIFQNPGSNTNRTRGITVNADYIIIEKLLVKNTQDAGIYINNGSDYVTVRYVEITNTGIGVTMRGANDKVLNSDIHDLHMVNNTVGGDDDYGANGILVSGTSVNGEIAYNSFTNCKAASYDYGVDGGTIEYYGTISGYKIHHNYAANNQGFLEIGSGATGLVSNNVIAYNVMYNNARPLGVHLSGGFGVMVDGLRFENNTIVDLQTSTSTIAINFYTATPTLNTLIMRNNIFYLTNYSKVASASTFTHDHNLYFFNGKSTSLGFTAGVGESIANPAFVNLANGNFTLGSSSPAINSGVTGSYSVDLNGYIVPSGGITDLGAHEYQQ